MSAYKYLPVAPQETFALTIAAEQFLTANDPFEQPISHSPTDHVQDMLRARLVIEHSEVMQDGPFLLEVGQPIKNFAATAHWLFAIVYKDPKNPDALALKHLTLRKEMPPLAPDTGFPCEEAKLYISLMSDLAHRRVSTIDV